MKHIGFLLGGASAGMLLFASAAHGAVNVTNSVQVTNSVKASASSGGQRASGGESITTGNSSASVYVETVGGGEGSEVYIKKTENGVTTEESYTTPPGKPVIVEVEAKSNSADASAEVSESSVAGTTTQEVEVGASASVKAWTSSFFGSFSRLFGRLFGIFGF